MVSIYIVIFFQLLLFVYHQITTNIDLYPFNDIKHQPLKYRIIESLSNGIFMIIPPIGFIFSIDWIIYYYTPIFYPALLVGMFLSWWKPYLFGANKIQKRLLTQFFNHTIKILPPIKDHPIPDLQHCILHAIAIITTILTLVIILKDVS